MTDAVDQEDREAAEERERLLYVACTRAIDLLILPQYSTRSSNSWAQLLDLKYEDLPELTLAHLTPQRLARVKEPENMQTADVFRDQQAQARASALPVRWLRPSEGDTDLQPLASPVDEQLEQIDVEHSQAVGSTMRGLVLHKLMEELLTGEVAEELAAVDTRAAVLLDQLGGSVSANGSEIAATALRTIALPAIKDWRTRLVPEVAIYATLEERSILVAGRADAIAYDNGMPEAVFDWKSDVAPSDADRLSYKSQVLTYARGVGARRGAIVYMSLNQVHWVETA
jgi:CRISPR-associated exonuclease Cas4